MLWALCLHEIDQTNTESGQINPIFEALDVLFSSDVSLSQAVGCNKLSRKGEKTSFSRFTSSPSWKDLSLFQPLRLEIDQSE